jgi:hypothetical protein
MRSQLENLSKIPGGYLGTKATIHQMKNLVDEGKKKYAIITLASNIVANVPERDQLGEVSALLQWVQGNIRFVNDPFGTEMVQAPEYVISRGAADCDCLSTLLNALAASIGYPTAFKTIKADPRMRGEFSHVYSLIFVNGKWMPADPSQQRPLGWEPERQWGSEVWGYSNGRLLRFKEAPAMKGINNSGSIENNIINWFRNRKKGKAQATPAAIQAQATPAAVQAQVQPSAVEGRGIFDDESTRSYYGGIADGRSAYEEIEEDQSMFASGSVAVYIHRAATSEASKQTAYYNYQQRWGGRVKMHYNTPDSFAPVTGMQRG